MFCSVLIPATPHRGEILVTPAFMPGEVMPTPHTPLPGEGQGRGRDFYPCLKRPGYQALTPTEFRIC